MSEILTLLFDESTVIPEITCLQCEAPMRLAIIEPLLTIEGIDRFVFECSCGYSYRHPVERR